MNCSKGEIDGVEQTVATCGHCSKKHNYFHGEYRMRLNEVFCNHTCMYAKFPELAALDRKSGKDMEKYLIEVIREFDEDITVLRDALSYLLETRHNEPEEQCLSPICKSGDEDEYCAYHKGLAALETTATFKRLITVEKKDEKRLDV